MSQRFTTPIDATVTLGTATGGAYPVYVQLLGPSGKDMKYRSVVKVYMSSDAPGDVLAIDSTDTTDITILTDGTIIVENTADVVQTVISEADGDIGFTCTVATGKHAYLNVILPNGRVVTGAIMSYGE